MLGNVPNANLVSEVRLGRQMSSKTHAEAPVARDDFPVLKRIQSLLTSPSILLLSVSV